MINKSLLTALSAVALTVLCWGCGDEPAPKDVSQVDVNYSIDLSADLVNVLNMKIQYVGDEGEQKTVSDVGTKFSQSAEFTKFPAAFGMKLLVLSVNESALTKDSYTLRLTYTVSAVSYDNEGAVVQNCPQVDGGIFSTVVTADKIKSVLEKDVENGEYFSTSNSIDKKGKIIVSAY